MKPKVFESCITVLDWSNTRLSSENKLVLLIQISVGFLTASSVFDPKKKCLVDGREMEISRKAT